MIIDQLAKRLLTRKDLCNVLAIPTAKVPIVKFMHMETELEGDISLYNTLVSQLSQRSDRPVSWLVIDQLMF